MTSIEALWVITYGDVAGPFTNGGIVVFETGRIFGGDSQFYYTGDYRLSGDDVDARVRVTHYHGSPMTAFGFPATEPFDILLFGKLDRRDNTISGMAEAVKFPNRKIPLVLDKKENLP